MCESYMIESKLNISHFKGGKHPMGQDYVAPLGWHDIASTSVLDGV